MKRMSSWSKMQKSGWLAVLAAIYMLLFCYSLSVTAATVVSGRISSSVRWVPESSPYIVSGDIIVARGATLTIAAGTEVRFRRFPSSQPYTNRGVLRVLGTLQVEGNKDKRVYFGLSENGAIGDWGGIWVDGYYGGRVIMEYAEVENAQRGIYVSGGSPVIKHSRFSSNFTGIHLEQTTDFNVEGNILSGNDYGIYLDSSQGAVHKNSVISNPWGIYSFLSKGVAITHNAIKSNVFGIINDGGRQDVIEYNDFSIRQPNNYGVYLVRGKPIRINHNNFFYDPEIVTDPRQVFWYIWNDDNAGEVNASNNWWDTVKPEIIEAYIMDRRDRSYLGLVNYLPLASRPIRGTADDISAPVVSINTLSPFSPVVDEYGRVPEMHVTYSLSETASELTARVIDINGLMGSKGRVLWSKTWQGADKLLRDGQHSWTWNARLAGGQVLADGTYRIEMVAEDREVPGLLSDIARTRLVIDSVPPVLTIIFPRNDETVYSNRLIARGTVEDDHLVGGFVLVRETTLLGSTRAGLDGIQWKALIPRLREGVNVLEVTAYDGAGNKTKQQTKVTYEPVLDLQITSPTNVDAQVIRGTIRNEFLSEIGRVDVKVNGQHYATKLDADKFATSIAVPLVVGENTIEAFAYDHSGAARGDVMAVIEYDPLYNITVEGSFPAGLQMVSVPMTPFQDDPTRIFKSAVARWGYLENTGPGYIYTGEDLERVTPYRGYWWKPDTPKRIEVTGKAYDPAKGFQFPLEVGWNQIGCPFLQPVQWDNVKFTVDQGRSLTWWEAVKEGWISRGLWTYRDGGYLPSTTLQPWSGYWVLARRQLEVVIPADAAASGNSKSLASTKGVAAASPVRRGGLAAADGVQTTSGLEPNSWSMQLSIVAGQIQDRYNYLGVVPGGKRGFDPEHDLEKPPPAGGPTLWLESKPSAMAAAAKAVSSNSAEALGAQNGLRLAADYRTLDEVLVWDILIENDANTEEVVLSWAGNWEPSQWQLALLDPATGSQLLLTAYGTRTLSLASGEIKHLQVHATSVGGELSLRDVLPYPNPWTMSRPLRLGFTITQSALVEARIYDVAGNLVRILPTERKAAGRHYFQWDGRNGRGRIAANGLYFYQVKARPLAGGRSVKAQGRLVILR